MTFKTDASKRNKSGGFTLIEILVVISIIIILVGTVLALGTQMRANAQVKQTKVTLHELATAMAAYLADGNTEPGSDQYSYVARFRNVPGSWKILQALPLATYGGGANTTVIDGFGDPIEYVQTSTVKQGYFFSYGPDGAKNTADDLYSFDP